MLVVLKQDITMKHGCKAAFFYTGDSLSVFEKKLSKRAKYWISLMCLTLLTVLKAQKVVYEDFVIAQHRSCWPTISGPFLKRAFFVLLSLQHCSALPDNIQYLTALVGLTMSVASVWFSVQLFSLLTSVLSYCLQYVCDCWDALRDLNLLPYVRLVGVRSPRHSLPDLY